jgi:GT2 family glycosyltransferase
LKLSVVILNYNVRYFLELALKSVKAAILEIDAEIIVVDNNSTDDSCQMVKTLFPEVKLIENKENLGFSKGNNVGVAAAQGQYVCVLNPDTVVAEDTFTKLLKLSETKTKLGVVGCRLINGSGVYLPESKRNIPTVLVSLKKILGFSKAYYANHLSQTSNGEVNILVGAFMFMEKDVYDAVGGFDEDYFMYGEDIDLSYKVLNSGYKNYYFGEVSVIHFKGESTLKDRDYARRFFGAMQIFYEKHFKQNLVFDLFVWFGIKMAFVFRRIRKNKINKISEYIFISKAINKKLENKLHIKLKSESQINEAQNYAEIILDANVLSYKDIIKYVENNDKSLTYKILPNQSNFILGSNNGFSQGEVIILA